MERVSKNTLFVEAAIAASLIVPIPQTACSALTRVFAHRYMTGSHFLAEIIYTVEARVGLNTKKMAYHRLL